MKIAVCGISARSNHFLIYVNFLASQGHDVTVITTTDTVDAPVRVINVARAIRGYRFMPPGMGLLIRLVRIFRALRTAPFDVLDVMQVTPDGVYAACFWRGPLMLDFWGSDIYRLSARSWWIRRLMPRVVRKADRIHAMSEHMARTLVALGADASRTEAFQYGIDFAQFGFGAAPRTSQEIIATRGLREFYRVDTIIRAMPRVLLRRPQAHLFLTKADAPAESLKALAADLGVEKSVTFLGLVSREEVSALLRRAAVWVSIPPSDGMPLSLLEAMASGALPVVSDLGTMREWLDESRAVFVDGADPGDVAEAILHGLTLAEDGAYGEPNRRAVEERGDRLVNLPRWERMLLAAAGRNDVR